MGLNGISTWQWVLILVIFGVAIIVAPGLARFRRGQKGDAGDSGSSQERQESGDD